MTSGFVICFCASVLRALTVSEGVERHDEGLSERNALKSMGSSVKDTAKSMDVGSTV